MWVHSCASVAREGLVTLGRLRQRLAESDGMFLDRVEAARETVLREVATHVS